jgi:D-alanyl-D-alanine carboxypeptidase/D-alanyl-D-alanine-endopeptidase (penicillin-binding protein 4)
MWNSPHRNDYVGTLALAGEDGTLDWRFSRTAARGLIRAKTGTLSHVTALSGYATTEDGRNLAFSIFVNNFSTAGSYVRSLVDRIVLAMIEPRPWEAQQVTSGASSVAGAAK